MKEQVLQWLYWASGEFSLTNINFFKFDMSGSELCDLGKEGFLDLAPDFVGDILWEHIEQMLRGTGAFCHRLEAHVSHVRSLTPFDSLQLIKTKKRPEFRVGRLSPAGAAGIVSVRTRDC